MKIGAMNHPRQDLSGEIRWIASMGFDFIDLTLEPPAAAAWKVDPQQVRRQLEAAGLGIVGHTAFYLPLASPFPAIRRAAIDHLRECLRAFAQMGAAWMNVHPDRRAPLHDRESTIQGNLESLDELLAEAKRCGMGLMIENLPGEYNTARQLGELLDPLPELGLHLDLGHCNLQVAHPSAAAILAAYHSRLRHVHLHDNKGGHADLHLPLGAGTIDVPAQLHLLRTAGYDDTITLEVFTPDRHFLAYSRDLLLNWWNANTRE